MGGGGCLGFTSKIQIISSLTSALPESYLLSKTQQNTEILQDFTQCLETWQQHLPCGDGVHVPTHTSNLNMFLGHRSKAHQFNYL